MPAQRHPGHFPREPRLARSSHAQHFQRFLRAFGGEVEHGLNAARDMEFSRTSSRGDVFKFSKIAATGTRVPRNTHVPLT
jgi:hypothetical protein